MDPFKLPTSLLSFPISSLIYSEKRNSFGSLISLVSCQLYSVWSGGVDSEKRVPLVTVFLE